MINVSKAIFGILIASKKRRWYSKSRNDLIKYFFYWMDIFYNRKVVFRTPNPIELNGTSKSIYRQYTLFQSDYIF